MKLGKLIDTGMDVLFERPIRLGGAALITIALAYIVWTLSLRVDAPIPAPEVVDPVLEAAPTMPVDEVSSDLPEVVDVTPSPDEEVLPTETLEPNVTLATVEVISCDQETCAVPLWDDHTRERWMGSVEVGTQVRVVGCFYPVEMVGAVDDVSEADALLLTPSAYSIEGLWCDVYVEPKDEEPLIKGMLQYWFLRFE